MPNTQSVFGIMVVIVIWKNCFISKLFLVEAGLETYMFG
jgi:hypothetical protein